MKKILLVISLVLLLNLGLAGAIANQEINKARDLIDPKVGCDKMTNEQLEIIGEYYMEQMRPGESHGLMHKMMGLEEGSEAEKQFHVIMARIFYCNEVGAGSSGYMMGMMPMMMNMISGNMMGVQSPQANIMQGMMGNWGYSGYWNFSNVLYTILLIGLIILVYLWITKLWRDFHGKKK
ncbi:MAG: hypothetical protein HY051_01855 [Candidatus Aenigmarchaeota archaeon]|nr:hypothetical protein [Candidatus Aenigmarchaeota archaeon]